MGGGLQQQLTPTGMFALSHLLGSFLTNILFMDKIKKHKKGSTRLYHKDSKSIYKPQDSDGYIGKKSSLAGKTGQHMQWLCAVTDMSTVCHSRQHLGRWVVSDVLRWPIYKREPGARALYSVHVEHGSCMTMTHQDMALFRTPELALANLDESQYKLVPFLRGNSVIKLLLRQRVGENNSLKTTVLPNRFIVISPIWNNSQNLNQVSFCLIFIKSPNSQHTTWNPHTSWTWLTCVRDCMFAFPSNSYVETLTSMGWH